ncbi:hypothetical protein [Malikia granosa]|uniref:hypothetical protein n=1 Tax=Malikia granosa TaxID=263067 RepID=UPI000D0068FD|nr:hypothetical protein [Malikia granosa]
MTYRQAIIDLLQEHGGVAKIPKRRQGSFTAQLDLENGYVHVDNLGNSSKIPLRVFDEIENLLQHKNGKALRGDAMNCRLGTTGLPLDSVEGRVAHKVFDRKEGGIVFRRITPMSCLLVWAGVCVHGKGVLIDPSLAQ